MPVEGNIVAIWAREVSLQRCTVAAPSDNVRLMIARSREQAGRRRRRSDSDGEPTMKDMFKLLIASAASQLTQSQPSRRSPARQREPDRLPDNLPVSTWDPLTYSNVEELHYMTLLFLWWWLDEGPHKDRRDVRKVFTMVKDNRIDLNMLMDPSEAGMPYILWQEVWELPPPLLLKLRAYAVRWQRGFKGLTPEQKAQCPENMKKEKERVEREEREEREDEDEDDEESLFVQQM
ncbi:hypothetical protein CC80DRAFT_229022 [Byssothecium circinans]|uniref:Uncharacterized protein n=1 Tax=Byssothecium circinans TaxID=147558 RepID=A0A6A5TD73_9PLEO|nr:hypothetical protein CC80DRAFT_229022 [Byssothecium circinans]